MPPAPAEVVVFIAWPGDNKAARDRAIRVIGELDTTFHRHYGIRIVAKDWKTHARPAGGNPQQAINNQVGRYDIFVGLLWTRLGMNAGRGKTGFEEEYAIARRQWRQRKSSLMLYVRTSSPPKLATINAGQLQQVQDFVAWVQKKYQALYWPYRTLTEFERELRQHLTDEIHARLKLSTAKPVETEAAKSAKNTTVKKAAGQKKPRAKPSLKSRLPIPTVPRRITDADRGAFARKALTTALREFRRAAKEFNASHPHAEIKVKQEGKDTFIALGEANGKQVVTARVRLEAQSWGSSWMLHYETGHQNFSFHGTIHYQKEVSVGTTDDGSTLDSLAYWGAYDVFPDGRNRTDKPLDVARAFWTPFVRSLTAHR